MRLGVEIQMRAKYGLNSTDLLIRVGWFMARAACRSGRDDREIIFLSFIFTLGQWRVAWLLGREEIIWNNLEKDTEKSVINTVTMFLFIYSVCNILLRSLKSSPPTSHLSSSTLRCALAHFNSSSCLSGTSATHQKATLPLLCFHKLLMLLNPPFFFSFLKS